MSSADKNENGELEQAIWRRFQDAEAMPAPDVWSRIDHELTLQENAKYKKRALFYRQLAAACFVLFMLAGTALLMHFKQDQEHIQLAAETQQQQQQNNSITEIQSTKQAPTIAANTHGVAASQAQQTTTTANTTVPTNSGSKAIVLSEKRDDLIAKSLNYDTGSIVTTTIDGLASESTSAIVTTDNSEISNNTIKGEVGYLPAGRAIANVPNEYISNSATTINPMLRQNATLGTMVADGKNAETIDEENQAKLALALNTPQAPEKGDKTDGNSRWSMGMAYAPSYFTQNIDIPNKTITSMGIRTIAGPPPGPSISAESEMNMREAREEFIQNTEAALSYNIDIRAGYKVAKILKLISGIGYSHNTSTTKTSYIVEQFVFNPRTDERHKLKPTTIFLPSLHTFTTDSVSVVNTKPFQVDYSYEMLSVPLGLQVEAGLGKQWYWYANGSMAANFLMRTRIVANNPEVAGVTYSAIEDSPFRKVQFSGNMGTGIGKRLSNIVNFSIGPEYRRFFNAMLTDEKAVATQGRPHTVGVNMALNYNLGR